MGTNYYVKRIPTEEDIQKLHELVDARKFESSYENEDVPFDSLKNAVQYLTEMIHICKISYGWEVLFDHNNGKYYQPTKESIDTFLRSPNMQIVDECERLYTPDEFWSKVEKHNGNEENRLTSESYQREYGVREFNDSQSQENVHKLFGIDVKCGISDFLSDGLRFATYTGFA